MILSSPTPKIDVYHMLKQAPQFLLQGINPYSAEYTKVYKTPSDYFTYWPFAFLSQIPLIIFLKDPRFLLSIFDILSAILLYKIGRKSRLSELFSLMYLYRPNSNFIIEQSWLASLETILFFLLVYVLVLKSKITFKNYILSSFLIGLMTLTKFQYAILFIIFISLFKRKITAIIIYFLTLFVFLYPFIIWDFTSFYQDTVGYFIKPLSQFISAPVHSSITLNTLYYILSGKDFNWYIPIFFVMFITLLLIRQLNITKRLKSDTKRVEIFIYMSILLFMSHFLFSAHVFINYYYVITSFYICLLTIQSRKIDLNG
jgi:hypothetical protein